jgi:hypothetical protein
VISTIDSAVEDFINSDAEIVLTDSQPSENRTFTMVDIRNGTLVQAPVEFLSSTPAVANFTRSKPEAYLIPRDWKDVVDRLSAMGVEFEELQYEYCPGVQHHLYLSGRGVLRGYNSEHCYYRVLREGARHACW